MTDDEDWTTHARCRDHVNLFDLLFDRPRMAERERERFTAEAAAVCRACPVRARCAVYAVEPVRTPGQGGTAPRHLFHGFWAGRFWGANDINDETEEAS